MPFSLAAGVGAKTSLGSVLPEWATLFDATLLVLARKFTRVDRAQDGGAP